MANETKGKREALRPSQNTAALERPANFPAPYVRHIPRRRSMREQAQELANRQAEAEQRSSRRVESPNTQDSDTTINKGQAEKLFADAGLSGGFDWAWENAIQGIRKSGNGYEVEESAVLTAIKTMAAYEAEKEAAGETDEDEEETDES